MVILDRPYVSDLFLNYLRAEQIPVLRNEFSASLNTPLNLVDDAAIRRLWQNGGRLYTSSENALAWVYENLPGSELLRAVNLMKDKAAMRRSLSNIYPDYFFREVAADDLPGVDISALSKPFILKPAVGFFSLGVYTINNQQDWQKALAEIESNRQNRPFPEAVVNQASFLLEEYIAGDEFAVDMYYDQHGEPVILNIMQHRFASAEDVSDRLYMTSAEIINTHLAGFSEFFRQINRYLKISNFPAHVELRLRDNMVLPIEFNPLRFAGLCTTDIAGYAHGINTVDCYLNSRRPDFAALKPDNNIYSMVIMEKPAGAEDAAFDYEKLHGRFQRVLEMRRLQAPELPAFAVVFSQTDKRNPQELDAILHARAEEFLLG